MSGCVGSGGPERDGGGGEARSHNPVSRLIFPKI